ncbi:MAG: hypothetical protein ABIS86_01340 [Streptosporangiaceae bacterium]
MEDERFIVARPTRLTPDGTAHGPPWCGNGPHTITPGLVGVGHERKVATLDYQGTVVTVHAYWSESLDRPARQKPIVMVTRIDEGQAEEESVGVDFEAYEAGDLAAILGGVDPEQLLQFASALARSAGLLGYRARETQ